MRWQVFGVYTGLIELHEGPLVDLQDIEATIENAGGTKGGKSTERR